MTAIKRNTYCTVSFDNQTVGTETYDYIVYVDADKNLAYDGGEDVVSSVKWSAYAEDVDFDKSQGGGDGLTFSNPSNGIAFAPSGLPRNTTANPLVTGTVYLKNSTRQVSIVVSASGNIRIP